MSLELRAARVCAGEAVLLADVSLRLTPGRLIGLLGPNGAGKTTAIRALLGLQKLAAGQALVAGQDVASLSARRRARLISYLPQARKLAWPVCVREAIGLGRFAYGGPLGRLGPTDRAEIDLALTRCDLVHLAARAVTSLSGGELARVHLARALVGQSPILIADEPTAALDPGHAFAVLEMLQTEAQAGKTVLVVLHDLDLATRFCDEVILLDQGRVISHGPPIEALSIERLAEIYGIEGVWDQKTLRIRGRINQTLMV